MKNALRRRFVPCALRLESRRLLTNYQATWLGQAANLDLTGPTAAVGPDGIVDDEIQLTTPSTNFAISYVEISLNGNYTPPPRWESSPDLDGYSNAEVIAVSGGSGKTSNVFFNPTAQVSPSLQTGQGQQLSVNVYYVDANNNKYTDNLTVQVGSSNPALSDTLSAPTSVNWNGFTASWGNRAYAPLFPGFSGVFMKNTRYSYDVILIAIPCIGHNTIEKSQNCRAKVWVCSGYETSHMTQYRYCDA